MNKKVVLITGGSGGIGSATAIELSKKGYSVCINYRRNENSALALQRKILNDGGNAFIKQADIAKENEVIDMFTEIDTKLGTITALVNNASILDDACTLSEMKSERIRRIFETNVLGTLLCSREAIKRMSTKKGGFGGAIVNISSIAARTGSPNEYIDYAASKGAIDSFTIGLAKEVAEEKIRVNGIRPGHIQTPIHRSSDRLAKLKETIPMRRIGQPEEIAQVISWLLSEEASYASGTIIDITGGK